jgi:hypothetical protein
VGVRHIRLAFADRIDVFRMRFKRLTHPTDIKSQWVG